MELQTGEKSLLEGVIEQASRYLLDPPRGSDPVISLASPAELISIFDSSVGLSLDESVDVADPESMLTAVEQIIEYSMHTSHPRFVNQNSPDPTRSRWSATGWVQRSIRPEQPSRSHRFSPSWRAPS